MQGLPSPNYMIFICHLYAYDFPTLYQNLSLKLQICAYDGTSYIFRYLYLNMNETNLFISLVFPSIVNIATIYLITQHTNLEVITVFSLSFSTLTPWEILFYSRMCLSHQHLSVCTDTSITISQMNYSKSLPASFQMKSCALNSLLPTTIIFQ